MHGARLVAEEEEEEETEEEDDTIDEDDDSVEDEAEDVSSANPSGINATAAVAATKREKDFFIRKKGKETLQTSMAYFGLNLRW